MSVDVGRAEVYAAESVAFTGTDIETVQSFDEIAAVIRAVTSGEWWPGPTVHVVRARRDARSSSAVRTNGSVSVIRLAAAQTTIATAAHELAHVLAGPDAGHSPVFLAAYLDLVAVVTNLDSRDRRHDVHVRQLRSAFEAAGLAVGDRRWPPPPEAAGTAIAL